MNSKVYQTSERPDIFSNLSDHPIIIRGKTYPTVEHFYQANISKSSSEDEKMSVLLVAIFAKARQHKEVRELLLSTGEAFIEDTTGEHCDRSGFDMLGNVFMQIRSTLHTLAYLDAPLSGLSELPNPAYTEWSSPALLISVDRRGNEVAEQLARQIECDRFSIPVALAPATAIPFQDYGIGVVVVGFDATEELDLICLRNELARLLNHELDLLKPRPLLMGIILPPPAPAICYGDHDVPLAFAGCFDCIWQPELQQVSTILPSAVNHWLNLYLNGGSTGFDHNIFHRLFGAPPYCISNTLEIRMVCSAWIENDEGLADQWVKALADELSISTIDSADAMLVILDVSEKCIHRLTVRHYDDLINECNRSWATQDRQVYVALSPSPFVDDTLKEDVKLTVFLR